MSSTITFIECNENDLSALRAGIEQDFDEGTLDHWPRESVMRALGFDEYHWIWSYFLKWIEMVGRGQNEALACNISVCKVSEEL